METFIAVREKVGETLAVMLIDGSYKPTPDQLCVVITFDMVLVAAVGLVVLLRPASVQILLTLPTRLILIPSLGDFSALDRCVLSAAVSLFGHIDNRCVNTHP